MGHQGAWNGDPKAFGMGTPQWLGSGGSRCFLGLFSRLCSVDVARRGGDGAQWVQVPRSPIQMRAPIWGCETPLPLCPTLCPHPRPRAAPAAPWGPSAPPIPAGQAASNCPHSPNLQWGAPYLGWGFFCPFPLYFPPFFQPILSPFLSLSFSSFPLGSPPPLFPHLQSHVGWKKKKLADNNPQHTVQFGEAVITHPKKNPEGTSSGPPLGL